jgi:hypothetical protein
LLQRADQIVEIEDVAVGGVVMTDGAGLISADLMAQALANLEQQRRLTG